MTTKRCPSSSATVAKRSTIITASTKYPFLTTSVRARGCVLISSNRLTARIHGGHCTDLEIVKQTKRLAPTGEGISREGGIGRGCFAVRGPHRYRQLGHDVP